MLIAFFICARLLFLLIVSIVWYLKTDAFFAQEAAKATKSAEEERRTDLDATHNASYH